MQLFEQIAARVFGPGRLDTSPANAHDATMPVGVGRDRVPLRPRLLASQAGDDASTKETASSLALISQSAIVLYVPTTQMFSYWQAAACPRAA